MLANDHLKLPILIPDRVLRVDVARDRLQAQRILVGPADRNLMKTTLIAKHG